MKNILFLLLLLSISQLTIAQAPAIQWSKCFGGSDVESIMSVVQTSDGGYIATVRFWMDRPIRHFAGQ